ncbi:MAG: von Willebrand factor type A domain-containing protein, partial [Rhizobiales bacterium]|nr:von Willebrand factor type A domain-containing protein [Hyphomicrobiales bacterium]
MTDDLETLRQAFRNETPVAPRAAARDAARALATARFSEISRTAQGSGFLGRLIRRARGETDGRPFMHSIRPNHLLLAGSSLAVLAIAIAGTSQLFLQTQVAVSPPAETKTLPRVDALKKDEALQRSADAAAVEEKERGIALNQPAPLPAKAKPAAPSSILAMDGSSAAKLAGGVVADMEQRQNYSYHDQGRDKFTDIMPNPVKVTAEEPVSTFSIDADSASYGFVRGSLAQNVLPQKDAVRVEEMINYFPYDYAGPSDREAPFKATVTVMPTPWNPDTRLMHIGIKGFALNGQERPHANLVFLLDTSGSMDEANKLPLLRSSMKLLVDTLAPDDTVAIVTYAGNAGTVLEPTKAKDKSKIIAALDNLQAGGSTAGAEGIRQAYTLAEANFDRTGINRVILATDGDFNVGITDPEELKSFVERKRETGVYLSVLGFGRGNYNDQMMQTLAQNGNGNASYIDTLNEARKVLVDEASNTLFPIAKDVKIQVEFNPQTVSEYRLIGYETRLLNREDFNNDKVDAGEIGSGHTVTAIYEITPKDSKGKLVDPLRYGAARQASGNGEYAFVKIRYKLPTEDKSRLITEPVTAANEATSTEASFTAAVAGFGQLLAGGQYT